MKKVKLVRTVATSEGTKGRLYVPGIAVAYHTMENPWLQNKRKDSCIPLGTYICRPVDSPRFGKTIEVTNVPDRSHILFHAGNSPDDTDGCILIGMNGSPSNTMWIGSSKPAVAEFLSLLGKETFELEITNETN